MSAPKEDKDDDVATQSKAVDSHMIMSPQMTMSPLGRHPWGTPFGQWQSPMPVPVGGLQGLGILQSLDCVWVIQQIELLELITGWETNNRYLVQNQQNQMLFFVVEYSDICVRQCCGSMRQLSLIFYDQFKRQVLNTRRPFRCQWCLCVCCLQKMNVMTPDYRQIGSIKQKWSPFCPRFSIRDENKKTVLKIKGPCVTSACCCRDKQFDVYCDGQKVGQIVKKWGGIIREATTDADIFGVTFPMALDIPTKANLIAAAFLLDYMYYESGTGTSTKNRDTQMSIKVN